MTPQTRFRSFAGAPAPVVKRRALLGLALATFVTAGCDKFLPGSKTPFNGVDITGSDLGPDFRLTDHNGKERSLADFRGKVVSLFFGYTHCPDVCPTTLSNMAQAVKLLGPDGARVQVLLVEDTHSLIATVRVLSDALQAVHDAIRDAARQNPIDVEKD